MLRATTLLLVSAMAIGAPVDVAASPTPWLGISYQEQQPVGALVSEVHSGTPAAAAGLRRNDVIVRVGGRPVLDFGAQIRAVAIGQRLTLIVDRDGRRLRLSVRLTARPSPDEMVADLLLDRDLPALAAFDEHDARIQTSAVPGRSTVVAVFDARCYDCATAMVALADRLARDNDDTRVRALVLADSAIEITAMQSLVPMPAAIWRVDREVGYGLLGALDARVDGALLVIDDECRIEFAAALSSGTAAGDGAVHQAREIDGARR